MDEKESEGYSEGDGEGGDHGDLTAVHIGIGI